MLSEGEHVPEAGVWTAPGERRTVKDLVDDGAALFLFFLFAWGST